MGLFDRLKQEPPAAMSPKAAMLLAAVTVIAADGEVDDAEIAILDRLARGDGSALDVAIKFWKANDTDACIAMSASRLTMPQRIATLANLVDIAMADGNLAGAERVLLEAYVEAFAVHESVVKQVVEVIGVKNDDRVFA